MGKINTKHVLYGGMMVGAILSLFVTVPWMLWGPRPEFLAELGHPITGLSLITAALFYFVIGVGLLWVYAAIRPRYGPGPRTAAIAAFVVWAISSASELIWVPYVVIPTAIVVGVVGTLPVMIGLTIWAASRYREDEEVPEVAAEEG